MTIQLPHAEPRLSTEGAIRIAVLSSLLAGLTWAALAWTYWMREADEPDANLGTLFAVWGVLILALIGMMALLIPMLIGLVSRSPLMRLAAAWVCAGICALGGVFWFFQILPEQKLQGGGGALAYGAVLVLFIPAAVTATVSRRVLREAH